MDKKLKTEYKIITSISQWEQIANCFTEAQWIGLDTEFMRDKSYYPQLCLVQLSSEDMNICLDTYWPLIVRQYLPQYWLMRVSVKLFIQLPRILKCWGITASQQ